LAFIPGNKPIMKLPHFLPYFPGMKARSVKANLWRIAFQNTLYPEVHGFYGLF
jgi:hypothetical protein